MTKVHTEREIVGLFEQGMKKYTFSTEKLEKELRDFLSSYINTFLKEVLEYIDK